MCDAAAVTALLGIATRLKLARLFVMIAAGDADRLPALAGDVVAGGADIIGFEAPAWGGRRSGPALTALKPAARTRQALVAYRGPASGGAAAGVDALVLAADSTSARAARAKVGEFTVIGRSCRDAGEVDAALADADVDFLLVGPGLDLIRHAAAAAPAHEVGAKTWFAAGGATDATLAAVLAAGAMRVVVGRGITKASDAETATRALKDRLRRVWADDERMAAVTLAAPRPSAGLTLGAAPPPPPAAGEIPLA